MCPIAKQLIHARLSHTTADAGGFALAYFSVYHVTSTQRRWSYYRRQAPCGSCNEWLKKVAEINPDFKVITFADTTCEEVFVQSVECD